MCAPWSMASSKQLQQSGICQTVAIDGLLGCCEQLVDCVAALRELAFRGERIRLGAELELCFQGAEVFDLRCAAWHFDDEPRVVERVLALDWEVLACTCAALDFTRGAWQSAPRLSLA